MYRITYNNLVNWKNDVYLKPLLIRGLRQVGKTTLIEHFGKQEFDGNVIKLDFEARPELKSIFKNNLEPDALLPQIELFAEKKNY
jgi:uncharacterized protein